MEYLVRVFRLREHGDSVGKYMDMLQPKVTVEEWLYHQADIGFQLDGMVDLQGGEHFYLRVVVKRERPVD